MSTFKVREPFQANDMAKVNSTADAKKVFGLYVKVNSILGLWPLLRAELRFKIRRIIATAQVMMMLGSNLYVTIHHCGDAEDSLDNLLVVSTSVTSLSKLLMYHVHREELSDNIVSAVQDWASIETNNYRSVMIYYRKIYKKITYGLVILVFWSCTLCVVKVLINGPDKIIEVVNNHETKTNVTNELILQKKYLFPSTCAVNNISETLHRMIILTQFGQMVTCCIVTVGCDGFFLAITTHLCGQFEILKMKYGSADWERNLSMLMTSREKMNALIARHQHLLRLTENLESAFNKIVLTQILVSIILVSVAGFSFLIALKTKVFFGSVRSLMVVLFMLLQSFMYTCLGEALQNQGVVITQSVYDASWFDLPRYLSRDLIFVMMRSNRSPCLTAGRFFCMTRATFMDVVKTSSSYLSILRIMLNE